MGWFSELFSGAVDITKQLVPAAAKIAFAGTTVTAGELEIATGSLGSFFSAMQSAIKAKNYEAGTEVAIEEAVTIAADLGFGEPFTGIAKTLLPFIFSQANTIAATPLIAVEGGRSGYVTQAWAEDPRHQLNADGTFKN